MNLKRKMIDVVGWYGVGAIIFAYMLISFEVIIANSWQYQLLNLTGAIGIIIEAVAKKDRQPVVLNIFWIMITLVALVRLIIK